MLSTRITIAAILPKGGPKRLILKNLHESILNNINKSKLVSNAKYRNAVEDCLYMMAQEKMIMEIFELLTVITNKFPRYIKFKKIKDVLLAAYVENLSSQDMLIYGSRLNGKGAGSLSQIDQDFISNCIYLDCLSDSLKSNVIARLEAFLKAG